MTGDYRERIYSRYFSTSYSAVNRPDDAAYRVHGAALRRLLAPHLPADRGARIVDVACGIGYAVHGLREAGYANVSGLDVSPEQVEVARGRGLPVERADVFDHLPRHEASFDAILALDFVEHLTKDELLRFFDLAGRALHPSGVLVMKTPNASSPIASRARYRDLTHELLFTEQSLREGLHTCGLQLTWCGGEPFLPASPLAWLRAGAASVGRALWKAYLVAELGREAYGIPTSYNLIAVARRP